MYWGHTWGEMKKHISDEKINLKSLPCCWELFIFFRKQFRSWKSSLTEKTSMRFFLAKGGGEWNMFIKNDKDSKRSLPENNYLIFIYLYDLGLPFLHESTLDISDQHSKHTVRELVMDLVLLAERSRKISILSTGHL